MTPIIQKFVAKALKEVASKIEAGSCELSEEQASEILSVVSHEVMSKDMACTYLNISRSKFDELVKLGKLPKGRKRRGFKELIYYKDDLLKLK